MKIRPLGAEDRAPLAKLLSRIETFSPDEITCALELIDAALQGDSSGYNILVAVNENKTKLLGYCCYGPTPMTQGTFDLYWIASDPQARGRGVGAALVSHMESDIRCRSGRIMRVETSATEAYGPTRSFYASMQYKVECRFPDFYRPGDDLIILSKRLM